VIVGKPIARRCHARARSRPDRRPADGHRRRRGLASAAPDTALLQLGVETRGATPGEALEACSRALEQVIAAVRAARVEPAGLATGELSVHPDWEAGPQGQQRPAGYRAAAGLTVRLDAPARAGQVATAAVAAGLLAMPHLQRHRTPVERRENVSGRASRLSVAHHVVVEHPTWSIPPKRPPTRSGLLPDEFAEEPAINRPALRRGRRVLLDRGERHLVVSERPCLRNQPAGRPAIPGRHRG
jgi:hypothetical protein